MMMSARADVRMCGCADVVGCKAQDYGCWDRRDRMECVQ